MVYDMYTLSPGYVFVHYDVSKTLCIPQLDSVLEFTECVNGELCEVYALMDKVDSRYKFKIQIPLHAFDNVYDIDEINDTIRGVVTNFFLRTIEPCMVYMYNVDDDDS